MAFDVAARKAATGVGFILIGRLLLRASIEHTVEVENRNLKREEYAGDATNKRK